MSDFENKKDKPISTKMTIRGNNPDIRGNHTTIEVPVGYYDLELFAKLLDGNAEPFSWSIDGITMNFVAEKEDEHE